MHMLDPAIRDCANNVIDRLFALDEFVANARAFRSFLEDLHARELTVVQEPHVAAIHIIRAAILRSTIGTVMACLDPADPRGNRASLGQILALLDDAAVVDAFREPGGISATAQATALAQARTDYIALKASDLFESGRRLRNEGVAHVLLMQTPLPSVTYETVYRLDDEAERLTAALYQVCQRGKPLFQERRQGFEASAKVFWDTYFREM
jgi:hypothetical protein